MEGSDRRERRTYEVFVDADEPLVVELVATDMEEALEEVRRCWPHPGGVSRQAITLREVG